MTNTQSSIDFLNMTDVFKSIPNRFLLSVAVAKRARQLREGYKPLIEITEENPNPIIIALKEIELGKLSVVVKDRTDAEEEYLDRLEQDLDLEVVAQEPEKEEKKPAKDSKGKSKIKSLAA